MGDEKSDTIKLRDSFFFANTLQFLHLFHQILGLDPITPFELENILTDQTGEENNSSIGKLYKKLIKALNKSKSFRSETCTSQLLNREYRRHSNKIPLELEPKLEDNIKKWPSLSKLSPTQRLEILFDLCTFQLFDPEIFLSRSSVRDPGTTWRIESVGRTKQGINYWFLGDCWLYKEDSRIINQKEKDQWECVAWDLASWKDFLENTSLASSRRKCDKQLLENLRERIFPLAEPLLTSKERQFKARLKKEQEDLKRIALLENRKRSSRLLAKVKIQQQATSFDKATTVNNTSSSIRPIPNSTIEKRPLTRQERVAIRARKIAKLEQEKMMETLANSRDFQSLYDDNPLDRKEKEKERGSIPSNFRAKEPDAQLTDPREPEDPVESSVPCSPIRLVVRMGPSGPVGSQLFIGEEEHLRRKGNNHATDHQSLSSINSNGDIMFERGLGDQLEFSNLKKEVANNVSPMETFPSLTSPNSNETRITSDLGAATLLTNLANVLQ